MKIAIVGSGISGLVCAYLLGKEHEVTLFEKNDYLGGHTRTLNIEYNNKEYNIDAGFIVFNKKTYPNFCKILDRENISYEKTEMSFSYSDRQLDFEYNGNSFSSLFAQKKNLFNTKFYKMLFDIIKFNRIAKKAVKHNNFQPEKLQSFIKECSFGDLFKQTYLYPMAQAIWSAPYDDVSNFSTQFILSFFHNHGLLETYNRPPWYVIKNGSKQYVSSLVKHCTKNIKLNSKVTCIRREEDSVVIQAGGEDYIFDKVIIATHSDQALKILEQPTDIESQLLNQIQYKKNEICLHTDESVMPQNKSAWASWNFLRNDAKTCQLTYYMNRLQNLNEPEDFFVSVNQNSLIEENKVIKKFSFSHPVLTHECMVAQKQINTISGKNNTYFCGAYWHNGFHEDGVNSALKVCKAFGLSL
tara:strand:- start:7810 stop:9048 length:1239 start_codon:yes stop_codon:yes gene_type:complete